MGDALKLSAMFDRAWNKFFPALWILPFRISNSKR